MKQYNDKKQARRLFNRFKLKNVTIIEDKGYYYFYLFLRIPYLLRWGASLSKMKIMNNLFIVSPINKRTKCLHNDIIRKQFQNTFYENKEIYSKRNNVEGVISALK